MLRPHLDEIFPGLNRLRERGYPHGSRVFDYLNYLSDHETKAEKRHYSQEPYSHVKDWKGFVGKCLEYQCRGLNPSPGWTKNSKDFNTAYWNMDKRDVDALIKPEHPSNMPGHRWELVSNENARRTPAPHNQCAPTQSPRHRNEPEAPPPYRSNSQRSHNSTTSLRRATSTLFSRSYATR